jgi:hypothetical protein
MYQDIPPTMRNKLIILVALIVFATHACAQQRELRQGCDFLKDLHFKNGLDTIMVLAYKNASVKPPPYDDNLSKLHSGKKLNRHDFTYIVDFKPASCPDRYAAFCKDTSRFAFDIQVTDYHKAVRMRCIVFEGYSESSHPYFVIDKIMPDE